MIKNISLLVKSFLGIKTLTLKEIKNIINNFNDIDKDTKDYLLKIINTLIMGIFH